MKYVYVCKFPVVSLDPEQGVESRDLISTVVCMCKCMHTCLNTWALEESLFCLLGWWSAAVLACLWKLLCLTVP